MMNKKTINEIAMAWKEAKRPYVKLSTFAAYLLVLENHLLPYFGNNTELREKDVQAFVLEELSRGLSVKTIKDILVVLRMVIKFGVKNEWMNYHEWDIKYPATIGHKELEVLTIANHKKILEHIRQNFSFMGLGVYISLGAGLRIGEVCGLKWSDVDITAGTITVNRTVERIYIVEGGRKYTQLVVNTPKTRNSYREIPMSKEC